MVENQPKPAGEYHQPIGTSEQPVSDRTDLIIIAGVYAAAMVAFVPIRLVQETTRIAKERLSASSFTAQIHETKEFLNFLREEINRKI